MTPNEWAGLALAISTMIGSFALMVRWLVKHYLEELKPNGGSSVKDQVNRLEARVDQIYLLLSNRD
jgi:hypothetical protein